MLINLQPYKSDIRARVQYLLYGTEEKPRNPNDVLVFGNAGSFVASGEMIPRKVKAFSYLISFKEDYETFKKKVGDIQAFVDELLEWLIPYDREDYEVLVVGHRDTDNFHFHITVLNRNLKTEKALYIPRTRSEVNYYQELRRYFAAKYGFELGEKRLVKHYVGDLIGRKELGKIKDLIANALAEYISEGFGQSRDDLIEVLNELGFEIVDVWESGVRVRKDGEELTLIGGLFDEREFPELRAELQQGARIEKVPNLSPREFRALSEKLERLQAGRRKKVQGRVRRELEASRRKQSRDIAVRVSQIESDSRERVPMEQETEDSPSSLSSPSSGRSDRRIRSVAEQDREGGFSGFLPSAVGESSNRRDKRVQWREVVMQKLLDIPQSGKMDARRGQSILRSPQPPTTTGKTREVIQMEERLPFSPEEIEKAKEIDPLTLIHYYGLEYQRVGEQIRVKAPWRDETEPSVYLRVNPATGHLIWKDFGGDQDGGSAIDFVMKASKLSFTEAVALLLEIQGEPVLPEHPEEKLPSSFSRKTLPKGSYHRVVKVKDKVTHTALTTLLRRKGLDPSKIPPYIKEVYWEVDRRDGHKSRFFGIGLQTTGGSWMLRTALNVRPKTVVEEEGTHHSFAFCPAREGKQGKILFVVEGITDYISLWQYIQQFEDKDEVDVVVLGGTELAQEFIESGLWQDYEQVVIGLDFDDAGEKARKRIVAALKSLGYEGVISSLSRSLSRFGKDINEILRKSDLEFEVLYNPKESFDKSSQPNRERGWEDRSPGL